MQRPRFLERMMGATHRLQVLGPGVIAAAIAVLVTINVMVIVRRSGEASPTFIASTLSLESSPPSADGQDNDGAAAPEQPTATPSPTPTVIPRPEPTPTVTDTPSPTATVAPAPVPQATAPLVLAAVPPPEGSLPYVSSLYAIAYPASWSVQPEANGDSFRQLGPSGPIRPKITVAAESLSRNLTAEQYLETQVAKTPPDVLRGTRPLGPYQVGGARALLVLVDQTIVGQRVAILQAFFTTPGVGWAVSLGTSPERLVRDSGTFLWMLEQLTFRR